MFDGIVDAIHREMETLEDRYAKGDRQMTDTDLNAVDKMAHALKCIATYDAMIRAEERGRKRGYSRDYDEGYSRRY